VFLNVSGSGQKLKMSLINEGNDLGHATGSQTSIGFSADLAVALAEGPLAAE